MKQTRYETAEHIGVEPHYLSIVFKKNTGISINEFRKADLIKFCILLRRY